MNKRTAFFLNDNWTFEKEGKTEKISIPHTWNALDGQDGGNDYFRGTCRYSRSFDLVKEPKKEYFLQFDGVNASAEVTLNGTKLGRHDGGYSTFRFRVTDVLNDSNELTLSVSNEKNDRVYPQMADFTFYGGIYRDVTLISVPECHFDLLEFGTPGIRVTGAYEGDITKVHIKAYTEELHEKDPGNYDSFCLNFRIIDADGNIVSEVRDIKASKGEAVLTVPAPILWDGIRNPYLYRAEAELVYKDENGQEENECDTVTAKFGIRTFRVDPDKGFILNGRSYPLHGVSRHQDYKGIGNALTKAHHEKDMELIRELGANTVRLAHYQHSQYFYDLCDRYGLIVWAEIPYISGHLENGNGNTVSQMKALITQNYNHPSIVTWGLSNEITIARGRRKAMLENHKVLNDLCHEMDPQRFTTLACYAMCNPFSKIAHLSDVVGFNLYLGWYVPGLWLNRLFISLFHKIYPGRSLCYSEYGAEAMTGLHSNRPRRGDHTEEYQAVYHEYLIKCFAKYPFLWSTYVWNMFDFAADARNQGGEPGMNHKGLVTFDRSTKKDSFYLYKSYWNPEPMVHITSKRFKERRNRNIQIKVYSNADSVRLFVNGRELSEKEADHVFLWKVKLLDGENRIEAKIRLKNGEEIGDCAVFTRKDDAEDYFLKKNTAGSSNWM